MQFHNLLVCFLETLLCCLSAGRMDGFVATAHLWGLQIPVLTFYKKLVFTISKEMYSLIGR